jgi:DNA-binding beta-propeller fold protein YncE
MLAACVTLVTAQEISPKRLPGRSFAPWQNLEHTKAAVDAASAKLKKGEKLADADRVRIVFYGQSLCVSDNLWVTQIVPQQLTAAYGDIFSFIYKARGGWCSGVLVAVYPQDIEPTDADLVIIHDYPYPETESYAALLFAGCKDKADLEKWGQRLTEDDQTKKNLTADKFLNNLGKPGIRNMVNRRGNRIEVLLLSDHCKDTTKNGPAYDGVADQHSDVLYPTWAKENGLGYLDLRASWKEALMKKFGNLSMASRNYFLRDGEHLRPNGEHLWAHCVLAYFGIAYDYSPFADIFKYRRVGSIPIGGPDAWDCLTVDSAAQRLYVSHGTKVDVIALATKTNTIAGEITNTDGAHILVTAPEFGLGLVTCGRENRAAVVDLKTLQILSKVATGSGPDLALYEPEQKEFYTFNSRNQSATVVDAKFAKVVTTIQLGGKPEFAAADRKAGLIYNNIEDKNEVVVIDVKTHSVVNHWPIAPGEEASGMAFDDKNHRLFLGCGNGLLVMMDSTNGKVLATAPIGKGVDGVEFDPLTGLIFASCGGDGTTTIARVNGDKLDVVQILKTEVSARTMALDPVTHRIYLSAGADKGKFHVLVFGPE